MELQGQIQQAFSRAGQIIKDDSLIDRLTSIAQQLGVSAKQLADDYDGLAVAHDWKTVVTSGYVAAFAEKLQKTRSSAFKENKPKFVTKPVNRSWDDITDRLEQPTPKRQAVAASAQSVPSTTDRPKAAGTVSLLQPSPSPTGAQASSPLLPSASPSSAFALRQNRGQVVSSLHEQVSLVGPAAQLCIVKELGQPVPRHRHAFMVEPLETKIQALDERIVSFAETLKAALPEDARDVDRMSVADVAQEPVWVVGRIICEADGSALNEASVLLEGSRDISGGARVKLDLSRAPGYRIFPGQVVAARGHNPTGHTFIVQHLVTHLPAPALHPSHQQTADVSMVVAAGPFTLSDNINYEPLDELLQYCSAKQPSVVVLVGPFVDCDHSAMQPESCLDRTFQSIWEQEVTARLSAWMAKNGSCRLVLMPSVRDVNHWPVFPQPGFAACRQLPDEKVTCVQNPSSFSCNGVLCCATSHDILKTLSASEYARMQPGTGLDRMSSLASHLLGQRSMYPVYPAAPESCLDTAHYAQLSISTTPDILLLPSDLAPFAKTLPLAAYAKQQIVAAASANVVLNDVPPQVVCINPGRLARGAAGGTFAHITVKTGLGGVEQRCRVDILRI